jgi:tRNA pseudouridine38-40 synthase
MTRIALRVAYDGRGLCGWQTQPSGQSIQDQLERALRAVAGGPVGTVCAGRTDAGVHALAQVVHFDAPVQRPLTAWVRGVNAHLPAAIAVQAACVVPDEFHARYAALRRHYVYLILRAADPHPIWAGRAARVHRALDTAQMHEAAQALVGTHDFSAFRSSQCQAKTPVRTVESVRIDEQGALLRLQFTANAFLHHMVRNLVGSLVWVGLGRRPAHWVAEVLAGGDRRLAAPTFAAEGLYFCGVQYDPDPGLATWPALQPPMPCECP